MTSTPDVDVVDILTNDHHEVLELIEEIKPTLDPGSRHDMAQTVIAEIMRHSVAEEMYVYPAMRDHLPDGESVVQHDIEEHQELEEALKALEPLQGDDDAFPATLAKVQDLLRHHASDEETEQFPQLRQHIPAEQLRELGTKVETAKQLAPTRPHPASPHSELFHKAFGPGVGFVDKLRDNLTGRARNT